MYFSQAPLWQNLCIVYCVLCMCIFLRLGCGKICVLCIAYVCSVFTLVRAVRIVYCVCVLCIHPCARGVYRVLRMRIVYSPFCARCVSCIAYVYRVFTLVCAVRIVYCVCVSCIHPCARIVYCVCVSVPIAFSSGLPNPDPPPTLNSFPLTLTRFRVDSLTLIPPLP